MKVSSFLFIIASVCGVTALKADNLITLFLKPYPYLENTPQTQEMVEKLGRPWKASSSGVRSAFPLISGIGATYGGYLTFSDTIGQISFPRKHTAPKLYILITPRLTPIMIAHLTIHHWELEEGTPAAMYQMELKQDPTTELYFWETTNADLPKNKRVPREAIVLFTNPKHIYIPTGITITEKSANLVLPSVYVKRGIKIFVNTLYLLNIKGFFGPERILQQKTDTSYAQIITD